MEEQKIPEFGEDKFETLITETEIQDRVKELGAKISQDYEEKDNKPLMLVCILQGAYPFARDLFEEITYENTTMTMLETKNTVGQECIGNATITQDLDVSLENINVLIVEDIIDTGETMNTVRPRIELENPSSIKICSLLSKPTRRKVEVPIDYLGFEIPDQWVVGYGLDEDGRYREKTDIEYKVM